MGVPCSIVCLLGGVQALIDAGALLAGMQQERVARHLLQGFAARSDAAVAFGAQEAAAISAPVLAPAAAAGNALFEVPLGGDTGPAKQLRRSLGGSIDADSGSSASQSRASPSANAPAPRVLGVVFYSRGGWQVMDGTGHVQPKATSPIKEHEAFVVFDEARCRCASGQTFVELL